MQTNLDGEEALLFSLQIYGFAICGSIITCARICAIITCARICDLRTGTSQKFADLRLRNEPKNLRTHLCSAVL
jgi:hypothetical protein